MLKEDFDAMDATSKDFFISYNSADKEWAEWIAWELEEAEYSTVIQAWDFQAGSDFIFDMNQAAQKAQHTIAVLSPNYFNAKYTQPEWTAAFVQDPTGEKGILLPVRVRECDLPGMWKPRIYIDLVKLDEAAAREMLLARIKGTLDGRSKPSEKVRFPKDIKEDVKHSAAAPGRFPAAFPAIWNIPYDRNPFFTGRVETLQRLHQSLSPDEIVDLTQPHLHGLGGIGKTQIAVEFIYRYRGEYEAALWVRADSQTLRNDFLNIANILKLPERNEQNQDLILDAIKYWLQDHLGWILIFDNTDDPGKIKEFLPTARTGHVLITTRNRTVRKAHSIVIEKMEPEEGATFLLKRANVKDATEKNRSIARNISIAMDGLPLALDQAGAYIEENEYSLSEYLDLYEKERKYLLQQRGDSNFNHPESVTTTFSMAFDKVRQENPASVDLLHLCSFLHPDAIPLEIITEGACKLGPEFESVAASEIKLNAAIKELLRYSLVNRNGEKRTLTVHQLVQAVLIDQMDQETQKLWAERSVRTVSHIFPRGSDIDYEAWERCQRYLPHAQACIKLIDPKNLDLDEAADLLFNVAKYFLARGQYMEAQTLYEQDIQILSKLWKSLTSELVAAQSESMKDTAVKLNERLSRVFWDRVNVRTALAYTLHQLGNYEQAISLYQQVLADIAVVDKEEYHYTSQALNGLAYVYKDQGNYTEAEKLYLQVWPILEENFGRKSQEVAGVLNNLGRLYFEQYNLNQAEVFYREALEIIESLLAPEHPRLALGYSQLGDLFRAQHKYRQAESYLKKALDISEKALGQEHPEVGHHLNQLGLLYINQRKYVEAERLLRRALTIAEKTHGTMHREVGVNLTNLGDLYERQKMEAKAEPFYQQALVIFENCLLPNHPHRRKAFASLCNNYIAQKKYTQADQLLREALPIWKKALGADHPAIGDLFFYLANLAIQLQKKAEALSYLERALPLLMKSQETSVLVPQIKQLIAMLKSQVDIDQSALPGIGKTLSSDRPKPTGYKKGHPWLM